jgi:tyrosinase
MRERRDYIGAVRCLAAKPAMTGLENAATHFDDFQATHSDQTPNIHWVVSNSFPSDRCRSC